MKFGGTSVEDADAFARVANIIGGRKDAHPVVVVSAMSRVTDVLLDSAETASRGNYPKALSLVEEVYARYIYAARSLLTSVELISFAETFERARREIAELLKQTTPTRALMRPLLQDVICSYGERLSATLLAAVLRERDLLARYVDARRLIITDEAHTRAAPQLAETFERTRSLLAPFIAQAEIPVLGGFIGASRSGATTTLGRNGSDYTASLVGASLAASRIEIWTDTDGVLSADPHLVSTARTVAQLSYGEAATLARYGAKVLFPKTIAPAAEAGIPLSVHNSRRPEAPSTIMSAETMKSAPPVKIITHKTNLMRIHVTRASNSSSKSTVACEEHVFPLRVFAALEQHHIVGDVAILSEQTVSLVLDGSFLRSNLLADLALLGEVHVEEQRALVCLIGAGVDESPETVARVLKIANGSHLSLIAQSNVHLAFITDEAQAAQSVVRLHEMFFERSANDGSDNDNSDDDSSNDEQQVKARSTMSAASPQSALSAEAGVIR